MTPDMIQALGAAIAAVLVAWQARTQSKVKTLEQRIGAVEAERDDYKHLLRVSVAYIRDLLAWGRDPAHEHGGLPAIPAELEDEV